MHLSRCAAAPGPKVIPSAFTCRSSHFSASAAVAGLNSTLTVALASSLSSAGSAAPCTSTTTVSGEGRFRYSSSAAFALVFRFHASTSRTSTTRRSAIMGRVLQRSATASGSSWPAERWSKLKSRREGSSALSRMKRTASSLRTSSAPWK